MYKILLKEKCGVGEKSRVFEKRKDAIRFFFETASKPLFVGHGVYLELFFRDGLICLHDFDAPGGHPNNWIGRSVDNVLPRRGRPAFIEKRKRHSVTLTAAEAVALREIGGGNLSLGISKALASSRLVARQPEDWNGF